MAKHPRPAQPRGNLITITPEKAARWKAAREALKIDQGPFADKIGVSQTLVSFVENGKTKQISRARYARWEHALALSADGDGHGAGRDDDHDAVWAEAVEKLNSYETWRIKFAIETADRAGELIPRATPAAPEVRDDEPRPVGRSSERSSPRRRRPSNRPRR